MSAIVAEPPPSRLQPSLFADLPETARRRPPRRNRAPSPDDSGKHAPASLDDGRPIVQFIPAPPPTPPDPAEMSQAELRALVAAAPDAKLAFLLLESARETRRRVAPVIVDLDFDPADGAPPEPNPALLRAAATAAGELSGEDDHSGGYGATPNGTKRVSGRVR